MATLIRDNGIERIVDGKNDVVVGGDGNAIATDASDGFLYLPTCAGTPTGTPTTRTGYVAVVFDSTNDKLYVYDGAWLSTSALT